LTSTPSETALRLTEKGKGGERVGEVVVVSVGPKEVATQLRGVLAMGADRAILVPADDAALDADAVARVLKAVVEREKPDLVRARQADGRRRLEPGGPGAGRPARVAAGDVPGEHPRGRRRQECRGDARGGRGRRGERVRLPAVVTVDLRIIGKKAVRNDALAPRGRRVGGDAALRLAQGHHGGEKKEIKEVALAELGMTAAPLMKVKTYEAPAGRKAGIKVASVEELVSKLHNEAKVI